MSDSGSKSKNSLAAKFLSKVMVKIRHDRPPFNCQQTWYIRYDEMVGGTFAQLWFLTRGCTWDKRGSCTMCNYGHFAGVDPMDMVAFVQEGLKSIDRSIYELYVSPSGSLLDEREVPAEARRSILRLVNEFPTSQFSFETRPETITASIIDELHDLLPNKQISVGFGLESADPWILRYCINKPSTKDTFIAAATQMRGINLCANVSLGSAFLAPVEAIDDAVRSVEWALEHGADLTLVFPMHIKNYTLLNWLYKRGLYEPPSLWSLIEVLQRLDSSLISRVNISWYRADYGTNLNIVASPATCSNCKETVLATLDEFRAEQSRKAVSQLRQLECECRQLWMTKLETPIQSLAERVFDIYRLIAEDFDLSEWWDENSQALSVELNQVTD